ncbi:hypothetical protein ACH50O_12445 [Methylomonas sp. 2BW1-5-20]|uniref:hypothetical protein n=1 Tax=Methylomonas sp. 2BW1-5-20 TaxID=3376686 RepID=UPI00405174BD
MNKITPHLLRDLNATVPEGTECYLCSAVRRALSNYRNGREPVTYLDKDQALPMLAQRLGRGLRRFFMDDIQNALDAADHPDQQKSSLSWPY